MGGRERRGERLTRDLVVAVVQIEFRERGRSDSVAVLVPPAPKLVANLTHQSACLFRMTGFTEDVGGVETKPEPLTISGRVCVERFEVMLSSVHDLVREIGRASCRERV